MLIKKNGCLQQTTEDVVVAAVVICSSSHMVCMVMLPQARNSKLDICLKMAGLEYISVSACGSHAQRDRSKTGCIHFMFIGKISEACPPVGGGDSGRGTLPRPPYTDMSMLCPF